MISKRLFVWVVLPALLMGTAAHGWYINDFSVPHSLGLTNGGFVYDTPQGDHWDIWDGGMPAQSVPWLSTRTSDLGTPTAWFYNEPDTQSGRMRHQLLAPVADSFNLTDGLVMDYRVRVGAPHPSRGPMGWRSTPTGESVTSSMDIFGSYIRLRNHDHGDGMRGTIDIQRDNNVHTYHPHWGGPNDYLLDSIFSIDWIILDRDMTDVWAEWRLVAKYNPDDDTEGRKWTYCQLYLDGELLRFDGNSGGLNLPEWEDQQWSFRLSGGMSGAGAPRITPGNVITQDSWDIEFDYINYVPEPASLLLLAFGTVFLRRRVS